MAGNVLYVIGDGYGPNKIGCTTGDPEDRCRALQTAHYTKLSVLRAWHVKNAREAERRVHAALSKSRIRGEWFDASIEEIEKVVKLPREKVAYAPVGDNPEIKRAIEWADGTAKLAILCGVQESTVEYWRTKKRIPKTPALLIEILSERRIKAEKLAKT